ncbi:hypothetical protein [Clostridium baratii]|uniref:hypothetical protein n=1 Tax=Clostridium baratii TaxID=1561 RepID=UPI0030D03D46
MNNKEYIQGLESMRQHAVSERRNYDAELLSEAIIRENSSKLIAKTILVRKEDLITLEKLVDNLMSAKSWLKYSTTDELVKELESRNGTLTIKKEPEYKNISDYGKCIIELIDSIEELKAAGYKNKQLVDMLEEHTSDNEFKYDIRVIKEIFENEIGYFEG